MYALRPTSYPEPPKRQRRVLRQRKKSQLYRTLAIETVARLSVNFILSAAGIAGLMQLVPYQQTQSLKLKELQTAVNALEQRLEHNRSLFGNAFDPYRTPALMQEQSHRIDAERQRIILQQPPAPAADSKQP